MRTVVVGASTGLGRCVGIGLAERGARVALMARRAELLQEAAREAGPDAIAITADVTDTASCHAAIDEAAERLGGIDSLVYTAGMGELRRIEDLDAATWQRVFATNVVGASLVTAAALPYLKESSGVAVYFSSVSASLTSTWPGLASYTVTKAALDKLVEAWRNEHPEIGFTRLIVGECAGGEGIAQSQFASGWDPTLAMELYPVWVARGVLSDKMVDVEHLVEAVDTVLRLGSTASIPTLAVTPRRPI